MATEKKIIARIIVWSSSTNRRVIEESEIVSCVEVEMGTEAFWSEKEIAHRVVRAGQNRWTQIATVA